MAHNDIVSESLRCEKQQGRRCGVVLSLFEGLCGLTHENGILLLLGKSLELVVRVYIRLDDKSLKSFASLHSILIVFADAVRCNQGSNEEDEVSARSRNLLLCIEIVPASIRKACHESEESEVAAPYP